MRIRIVALALTLSAVNAHAAAWVVDQGKSKLGFSVVWSSEPLKATFKKWTADIDFDPADPTQARVAVMIDVGSMTSEDANNDRYRVGPNGFDAAHFREARFVTKSIRATSPGHYEATADLMIHGVTKEVRLPFALTINGNVAHMTGELQLSRADYKIGTGSTWGIDWASERTVAHAVKVNVDLTATKKP
jgi:polyisoprenoid-binding protein YceI